MYICSGMSLLGVVVTYYFIDDDNYESQVNEYSSSPSDNQLNDEA